MKVHQLLLVLAIITFTCSRSSGQKNTTIDKLEQEYTACLDKGKTMLGCARIFYRQMDSMLNVQYTKLRISCDQIQAKNLKEEQVAWLAKRDEYFKKTLAEFKKKNPGADPYGSSFGARDDAMIMFDNNATFVKSRVVALANTNPAAYSAVKLK